jgi:myo-inositol-1(or 4)-monophosphatase
VYCGAVGVGLWRDNTPVTVTATTDPLLATVLMSRKELAKPDTPTIPLTLQPIGSTAAKLAMVAAGEADAVVSYKPRREWGSCAGTALVLAGGGTVTDLSGADLTFNRPSGRPDSHGLIACGPELHHPLLAHAVSAATPHSQPPRITRSHRQGPGGSEE